MNLAHLMLMTSMLIAFFELPFLTSLNMDHILFLLYHLIVLFLAFFHNRFSTSFISWISLRNFQLLQSYNLKHFKICFWIMFSSLQQFRNFDLLSESFFSLACASCFCFKWFSWSLFACGLTCLFPFPGFVSDMHQMLTLLSLMLYPYRGCCSSTAWNHFKDFNVKY